MVKSGMQPIQDIMGRFINWLRYKWMKHKRKSVWDL